MKNWIQVHNEDRQLPCGTLRTAIREAWNCIEEEFLDPLTASMPARMEAAI